VTERRLRLDFVVALCALLISTVAAAATVYQTHVIARQFSATVWPYVSLEATNSPASLELDIRNDGLGPAILRSVTIAWDGKPQPSIEALFAMLRRAHPQTTQAIRAALRAGATLRLTTSTPTVGMVIPANSQHTIIRMDGAVLVRRFQPEMHRFGLAICYCSLTGSCWSQSFANRAAEPRSVRACT
jgi:hypothetical protein